MNLAGFVLQHADREPDRPAIHFRDRILSFGDVAGLIESIAALLTDAGVRGGDRVGLSMAEHPLHLVAHFAVARLGAVIVPMDHRWSASEKSAAAAAFDVRTVLVDGGAIGRTPTTVLDEAALPGPGPGLPPLPDDDRDVLISLSSGTTGRPKGALLTHRNLYERFVGQWRTIGYGADDGFAILTPFYFGAGRSFGMSLLVAGGRVRIAPPPLQPPEIVAALTNDDVSATFLPPTLLRRLLPLHRDGQPPLLGRLAYLVVSGEPLFADEARECVRRICPNLYSYYASSEGGGISILTPAEVERHADTVGRPAYRTDVEIVDANDRPLPDGRVGRLRYRGPGVSTRFVDSDGVEHDAGAGGWFYPGDLAERLPSGHLALRGRDRDIIIRGGVNIYPAEIEAVLLGHPAVSECAVIGQPDDARGEIVVAFVVADDHIASDELMDHCAQLLAPYKQPSRIHRVPDLPRHTSGKIDKRSLMERHAAG
ncbi:MAG: class I adenylate-forming enzyme family protein [Woeseiaceae bacterium]|nr:class I adenylate-forming enzyme family protein [Woeseiaceae bacterium]